MSDRETRYGIVQQASIDSTDSRLCYLTSSEVCRFRLFIFLLRLDIQIEMFYKYSNDGSNEYMEVT